MNLRKYLLTGFLAAMLFLGGFYAGHFLELGEEASLLSPFSEQGVDKELPLRQYTIENLAKRRYQPSSIVVERVLEETDSYTSYLFSYTSLNKKISGQLNVPNELLTSSVNEPTPAVLMLRGYVPEENYTTGAGTRNAAAYFAENGYLTIAPDFLGHGESDPEPSDVWEARFIKPINVIELITSLKANPTLNIPTVTAKITADTEHLNIWAHSNGGQIALTTLEILGESIPTTLWAPVTSPFPYSVLYYSDENEDEGRDARAWVAQFEQEYDGREFSITQHLDRLTGPILLHHGTLDEAAPLSWSDEFVDKIEVENQRRAKETEAQLPPIEITYHTYSGTDHNMQPNWNTVVQRDLSFFNQFLEN